MIAPVTLSAFYYDNRGDPVAFTSHTQWGWRTRFLNLGARIDLGPNTQLLAQGLTGSAHMGQDEDEADELWVETRFRAAYLRLSQTIGHFALSGRLDLFATRQHGEYVHADDSEDGWALTGAGAWHLTDQAQLILEWLHTETTRDARARLALPPRQNQDVLQAAMRITL